ncbi:MULTISPECIES: hypothetical protein [unclassified Streptomyces]|jgi:hypothetical protein|uniref:Uncharacterized protein n=1 Tax=Streptomyces sp. NBC_01393 TaxID=2903851 RepID=A0AAU3I0B6_9ACTN|nr:MULTISPECIES: hypothetical protein [unclassified Streptomyces]WRZ39976.1 hypothetical protein OG915_19165 [Streptomyces sp. NBC_00151]
MSASESAAVPASERDVPAAPRAVAGVSMRDLLAACAAAEAVSRPPVAPLADPGAERPRRAA